MSATGERRRETLDAESGATLLEMLVVVALMAMIGAISLASFRPALRRASLGAAGGELVLALAQTRAAAIRSGHAATLAVAPDGESYTAAGRRIEIASGERLAADPSIFTYSPEGTSSGGTLWLSAGGRRLEVRMATDGRIVRAPG